MMRAEHNRGACGSRNQRGPYTPAPSPLVPSPLALSLPPSFTHRLGDSTYLEVKLNTLPSHEPPSAREAFRRQFSSLNCICMPSSVARLIRFPVGLLFFSPSSCNRKTALKMHTHSYSCTPSLISLHHIPPSLPPSLKLLLFH